MSNEDFVKFVSNQIEFFLAVNGAPGVSASLLWETLKAYIRGEIISYSSFEDKKRMERILQLDNIYAYSPSPNIYKDRLSLQAEFDVLSTNQTVDLLLKAKHFHYEYGDKASKLLAHQLRQASTSHQIQQIHSGITSDPRKINDQFKQFYSLLYSSEINSDSPAFDSFFESLDITKADPDSVKKLEEPITVDELKGAIFSMQSGKCPGPNGFPIKF